MVTQKNREKLLALARQTYRDHADYNFAKWCYDDGCILTAAMQFYEISGDARLKEHVIEYMNRYVAPDGAIRSYVRKDQKLDDLASGRPLLFAWEHTGEERYKKAVEELRGQLADQPRTWEESFWHKRIYPDQVWLDGLFMAQPFYMACDVRFEGGKHIGDIIRQFQTVRDRMYEEKTRLFYHGYDASRKAFWADPETGCSANFWLRAIGWFMIACVDTVEEAGNELREQLELVAEIYRTCLEGLLPYRDPVTGLFYQVVDRGDLPGNYLESSGTAMIAASVLKACRLGILSDSRYRQIGESILNDLAEQKLAERDGRVTLSDNCRVAGLGPENNRRRDGTADYYLSEPVVADDRKGIAAVLMAYAQLLRLERE